MNAITITSSNCGYASNGILVSVFLSILRPLCLCKSDGLIPSISSPPAAAYHAVPLPALEGLLSVWSEFLRFDEIAGARGKLAEIEGPLLLCKNWDHREKQFFKLMC